MQRRADALLLKELPVSGSGTRWKGLAYSMRAEIERRSLIGHRLRPRRDSTPRWRDLLSIRPVIPASIGDEESAARNVRGRRGSGRYVRPIAAARKHTSGLLLPHCDRPTRTKKLCTLLDLCVSSLRRCHANLLCIVPILPDDPRREECKISSYAGPYARMTRTNREV